MYFFAISRTCKFSHKKIMEGMEEGEGLEAELE